MGTTLLLSTRSDATEDTLSLTHSTLALSRRQEEKETASMGDETEYIKLKVVGQDSNEIHFRVKADHSDGQTEEVLQRASGRPGQLAALPLRRPAHQRRRDAEGSGDGAGSRHRSLPRADGRAVS